ncbi:TetR family transcriptional regulator [Promicromonospora thailandica]|uniref:Transcriptional regulator, TetR family n=1 Tax=Promicromonospora thailandica TaxID=765201 RepID=A0A9X2G3T1_9MICO|nr:TetR family transcriptional regulator [Promicromonospora thailandica]MCP2265280.1 transcriptional regulator, TetR family [Promicromonospora thailandica]BFF19630.1 TetR/AcrR family transcriptional regulator [Promicromonospora thailandica]
MAEATAGHEDPISSRSRIIAAAARLTCADGWSRVTMARLAAEAGVSRQTVYNAVGSREDLAEAMVLSECAGFVFQIAEAFDEHPGDLLSAIRAAVERTLVLARGNELLRAVVSATHGADTELLPLLTTHSEALLGTVKVVVQDRVDRYEIDLEPERITAVIDLVVRAVLSHAMQPSATPGETAGEITWIVARLLRSPVRSDA